MNRIPGVPWLILQPYRLFALVLGIVFSLELVVMLVLPILENWVSSRFAFAAFDSFLLSIALVPFFWKLIVVPLRQVADLRLNLIDWSLARQESQEKQIAANLHDGIGQMITGLTIGLRAIETMSHDAAVVSKATELRNLGKQIHEQLRQIARELRPPVLDDVGLNDAIRNLVDRIQADHGIKTVFESFDLEEVRLPPEIETAVYRITQEAITNALRHGKPTFIEVKLRLDLQWLAITIHDDGQGFDVAAAFERKGKKQPFGLHSMLERAKIIGGSLEIRSVVGKGTTVQVLVPRKAS